MPGMSLRKFQTLHASILQASLQSALAMGYDRLDDITDADIVKICPNKDTMRRGMELLQDVIDFENEGDFALQNTLAVFFINDAGNKKKMKLTQRLICAYSKVTNRIILRHVGATTVASGKLAATCKADAKRLNIDLSEQLRGSCTDSATDVIVTFVNAMHAEYPKFVGTGCVLHILHLMMMRPIYTAFGEQIKPKEGQASAGGNGVLRIGFMVKYLIDLDPDSWRDWAKTNCPGLAFVPTGASEGRWWSVQQSIQDVAAHYKSYSDYFKHMGNGDAGTYIPLYQAASGWLLNDKLHCDMA